MRKSQNNYPAKNVDTFEDQKPCTPHFSTTIAQRLEKSLRNTIDPFESLEEIDTTVEKTLNVLSWFLKKYPHRHQQIFDEICNFFNNLFSSCHLRNFYNSAPNITLRAYNESWLSDQLVNNVYVRSNDETLFRNEMMNGASCHYWSIFMKNVFDRLQEVGLPVESYIYMFNEKTSRHSGVILKHKKSDGEIQNFIIDAWGINKVFKKLILPIDAQVIDYSPAVRSSLQELAAKKDTTGDCLYFDHSEDFIAEVSKKQSLAISLEFHSPFEGEHHELITLKITPWKIHLTKGALAWDIGFDQKLFIQKMRELENTDDIEVEDPVLEALFESLAFASDETRILWDKYFQLLRGKINARRLAFVAGYEE